MRVWGKGLCFGVKHVSKNGVLCQCFGVLFKNAEQSPSTITQKWTAILPNPPKKTRRIVALSAQLKKPNQRLPVFLVISIKEKTGWDVTVPEYNQAIIAE